MTVPVKNPLARAFERIVSGESAADRARKPAVVGQLLNQALMIAKPGAEDSLSAYCARLEGVLGAVKTRDLETLRDRNIAICLDSRLSAQNPGGWRGDMLAIFHNDTASGGDFHRSGVVALWDNGEAPAEFSTAMIRNGAQALGKLARLVRWGRVSARDERLYAARYSRNLAKSLAGGIEWNNAGGFDAAAVENNPLLLAPPIQPHHAAR